MIGSKISKRYAKALLSLGQEDGNYDVYGKDLGAFARFCAANEQFFQVVSNQIFSVESRRKVLEAVLERSDFSPTAKNFLKLLLEKNRMGAIHEISDHYATLTDELSNITRAEVVTAKPLKKEALKKLEKVLAGLTSKEVKMVVEEDQSLIGGVVVKIGDLVLDGSVRAQLDGLKESLRRGEYI